MKIKGIAAVLLLGMLLVAGVVCGGGQSAQPTPTPTEEGVINLTFNSSEYEIIKGENNLDEIRMEGFYTGGYPGSPELPSKVYEILVPPDVVWSSLNLKVTGIKTSTVDGTYDIKPAAPEMDFINGTLTELWGPGVNVSNGRNVDIYERDSWFPQDCVKLLSYSQMRKWKFTMVVFRPFRYNPVSGNLTLIESVSIDISYNCSPDELDEIQLRDTVMDDLAPQKFFNYDEAKQWYLINETSTIQD
jgi:hypothetical protein